MCTLAATDKIYMYVYIRLSKCWKTPEMLSIKRVRFVIHAGKGISMVASVRRQQQTSPPPPSPPPKKVGVYISRSLHWLSENTCRLFQVWCGKTKWSKSSLYWMEVCTPCKTKTWFFIATASHLKRTCMFLILSLKYCHEHTEYCRSTWKCGLILYDFHEGFRQRHLKRLLVTINFSKNEGNIIIYPKGGLFY